MFSLKRAKAGIMHAVSGELREIEQFPYVIGIGEDADWALPEQNDARGGCRIERNGRDIQLTFDSVPALARVDGDKVTTPACFTLDGRKVLSLLLMGEPLLVIPPAALRQMRKNAHAGEWEFEDGFNGQPLGRGKLRETLLDWHRSGHPVDNLAGLPGGIEACPFWIQELAIAQDLFEIPEPGKRDISVNIEASEAGDASDMTCPACWLGFDAGSMLAIACHDDLTDPVLGNEEHLRFEAEKFDLNGHPLDPMGLPATGFACPHCRHRLPTGFHEIPHHIFSLVGASQAGKSYYLSILIRQLQRTLFRDFNLAFRDQDPQANAILNEMKQRVFQSARPEDAYLVKTQLEGEMYVRLRRHGKEVALPRPFIFQLSMADREADSASLIFYDNAGEHFQPQVRIEDSPGALHVAASSAIFFLFDPAPNPNFRALLKGYPDPQLTTATPDGQDVIMAEMESRIKRIAHVPANRRINTPMAVMIGKCDIWKHLIEWDALQPTLVDGKLDMTAIAQNSKIIRDFMLQIEPSIVANAEALSAKVCYFALSSFGHSPRKLAARDGITEYLAPDPEKIKPIGIEAPTLWALREILPQFIPAR